MSDSDESRSFASMIADNEPDPTEVEEPGPIGSAVTEGYSLVILIKSLVISDVPEDDPRMLDICIILGDTEAKLSGTMAEINGQRRGSAISVPASNANEFKQYLMDHSLRIAICHEANELGRSTIQLAATNLAKFEPPEFEPTMIKNGFLIEQGACSIGTINLLLKTDRVKPAVELDASMLEDDDSVMYILNDSPLRRSSEYQEDTMRQLLTCKKCNVLKSPSEISCKYELIDGILVNNDYPKKDPDLETIKRKIEQIEREAKLYPVGKEQEPPKEAAIERFCKDCGGYSVTGATCANWKRPTAVPVFEASCGYPEGTAKRFSENVSVGMPENVARISEPNFAFSRDANARFHQVRSESYPLHPMQHQGTNIFCPQSVGHRFCKRCSLNMDWLPLYSACPKCGYMDPADRPTTPYPTGPKTDPNRLDSWMGSFELPDHRRSRSSIGTIRSVSLDLKSCPLCKLRGGRCPDCKKRTSLAHADHPEQYCTTQSSTSDSEMLAKRVMERPKTRPSLRDRFGGFPKKIDKAARVSELFKLYGEDSTSKQEQPRRSSVVSLNVEEILKKTDTHKRKILSGGVQSIELRKVDSKPADRANINGESLSSKQIRKNQRSLLQRIKKQNRGKYSYHSGNRYPGIVIGHRECIHQGSSVPPHMGWMWNVKTLGIGKIRKGWRPGAVRKPIKELMQHFLVSYPLDNVPVSRKGGRRLRFSENDPISLKQKPTLQIIKKNGEYCIVMNPLKDSESLKTAQDPYLPCEPIRFKLAKDPMVGKLYQLRQALKVKGFTMCGCPELESCEHRSVKEKKLIKKELRKLTKCLALPKSTELKDVPIDSESEMDLEFTPPSAMLKSGLRKPDVVCTETQYCVEDYKVHIPADKMKCKPGREDPQDVGSKGVRTKLGRGATQGDTKDIKGGKGGKGGNGGRGGAAGTRVGGASRGGASGKGAGAGNVAGTGKGIGAGAGKGAGGKGVDGTRVGPGAGVGAAGSKAGAAGRNKVQKVHRPEGNQALTMKESGRMVDPCAPSSNYHPNVPKGCGIQSTNACYPTHCTPMAACYNPCYTGCMQ
ncbi:uncharacterized protein LOC135697035 [Ochlerotatus camptorhynchus]|uniref:uncharacterized protein LOC135697035 n=1 Tax=Ochlerotatus camptorhynchus TaxID=644619 RepID=UPI0031CE6977